jgi:iron complex outermembrane receptor protein
MADGLMRQGNSGKHSMGGIAMTRSRARKLKRSISPTGRSRRNHVARNGPLVSAILACLAAADIHAQAQAQGAPADQGVLTEIIVTATKRQETLQNVPLSIQALGTAKLEELHVTDIDSYIKYLPSVSYQTFGPGFARIYMRGVSSGGDGNHTGPLPSVGIYLDEQPITTIQGPLDVHIYDIARVEQLEGPQGTLYGASSQAGTIRIITNKPDPAKFSAAYDVQGSTTSHGDASHIEEGFVNLPLSPRAAIRLVGWDEHDGGYINNVHTTRTYTGGSSPIAPITIDNANIDGVNRVANHYNPVDITGGRAALRLDLTDTWTVTPVVMAQETKTSGSFAYDPKFGELSVGHFYPEYTRDAFVDAALTLEGKISDFDIVYAGAMLKRHDKTISDYTDYSLAYDSYSHYFVDANGKQVNPSQQLRGQDHYRMWSHELRVSSPSSWPVRFVAGVFTQHQEHDIEQRYVIPGIAPNLSVDEWPDTWWLTDEKRINRDYAAFTEVNYDILPRLTATAGIRHFKSVNTLEGFYGFSLYTSTPTSEGGLGYSTSGEKLCFSPARVNGGPCENILKETDESGNSPKLGLSWRVTDDHMLYVNWAKGFRPGGVNRIGVLPPYKADFLTSYEIGWKTQWFGRFRWNGAFYLEDWKDFQFAFLQPGTASVTQVTNAGNARIKGVETQVTWEVITGLELSGGFAVNDAKLIQNYCPYLDSITGQKQTSVCLDNNRNVVPFGAPAGQQLPVTPRFKGDLTARYVFSVGDLTAHIQGAFVYQSSVEPDLRTVERAVLGQQAAYGVFDFTTGVEKNGIKLELFVNNAFDKRADIFRYAECTEATCGPIAVYHAVNRPRQIGLKLGQKF